MQIELPGVCSGCLLGSLSRDALGFSRFLTNEYCTIKMQFSLATLWKAYRRTSVSSSRFVGEWASLSMPVLLALSTLSVSTRFSMGSVELEYVVYET